MKTKIICYFLLSTSFFACKDDKETSTNPNTIVNIVVSTDDDIVFENGTTQYTAKAYNYNGDEIPTTFNWSISRPSIGGINSNGEITGFQVGTAEIIATAQNVSSSPKPFFVASRCGADTLNFPFLPEPEIICSTHQITMRIGESRTFSCDVWAKHSSEMFCPAIQCISDTRIAEKVGNALVGIASGNTIITAAWNGKYKFIYVTITP